ncbi:MAG: endonuclease V, partial [Actinobacteria bacterium]|nr:endonuclease V [Actinomycetota bacterium]
GGYCHPRRFGIASHLGLILNLPSIGCAKSNLCGEYDRPVLKRGEFSYIIDGDEVIGAALVNRDNKNPVFISTGHRISLKNAMGLTLKVSRFRIPEPIRQAHNFLKSFV